jgi:hypothetical protein
MALAPHVPSALLWLATATSVVSSLAFLGYLLVPALLGAPGRSQLTALYLVGLLGLAAAELCQVLGIHVLIGQWLAGTNTTKQFRELLVLLLCLIPYVVVAIFLVTLIVYVRTRAQDPASQRTKAAGQKLQERGLDTLVAEGSEVTGTQANAAAAQARPTLQDAVRRVIGPATARSVSSSTQAVLALSLGALLLSTVVSVGVVVPAHVLAPLQSAAAGGPTGTTTLLPSTITSVSKITSLQTQTVIISGSGFGTQAPFNGDLPCIEISDQTAGWNAGHADPSAGPGTDTGASCSTPLGGLDLITIQVSSWNDTAITFTGFTGQYGSLSWVLSPGDQVRIQVWNAQTGAGPAAYTTTVQA